jgi:hypothetical protein
VGGRYAREIVELRDASATLVSKQHRVHRSFEEAAHKPRRVPVIGCLVRLVPTHLIPWTRLRRRTSASGLASARRRDLRAPRQEGSIRMVGDQFIRLPVRASVSHSAFKGR